MPAALERARIFVVEDESITAMALQHVLEKLDYSIAGSAFSGADAIQRIEESRPDLVFMDIRLKGEMDGIETAEVIRNRFHLPVIYLTAHADDATLERAKITEPYGFIVKPFMPRDIQIAVDIALYKHKNEKRLRDVEKWFSSTFKSIGDAVIVTDCAGNITFMNAIAEGLTGINSDGTQRNVCNLIRTTADDGVPRVDEILERTLHNGITSIPNESTVLVKANGFEIPIEGNIAPVRNDAGEVQGTVIMFRDVTNRASIEAQLRQDQKMEVVGQLASGVAHDFNNILTIITGYTSLLLSKLGDQPAVVRSLQQISQAAERAANLNRQLLMFSRNQTTQPKLLQVSLLVDGLLPLLRRMMGERIEVALTESDQGVQVRIDPALLEQSLINLATNSRDAMPEGGRFDIDIRPVDIAPDEARRSPKSNTGSYVAITVQDTGCGMDEETRKRIFEPFFTKKEFGKGPGLGLSAVYGVVSQHGGWIDVSSAPGGGATFRIFLPQAR